VQIKGISDSNTINFVDRARGGQGNDHNHKTNKGKVITSKDCDIYAVVDKEVGTCYLIPVKSFMDPFTNSGKKTINISKIGKYRENWNVIGDVSKIVRK